MLRPKYTERVTLTLEGFAYLTLISFITLGSVLRNVNLLILMAGIMLAPLLINWRLAVHRSRTLRGRRQLPSQINANQIVNVNWHCENLLGSAPAMNVIIEDKIQRASEELQTLACGLHPTRNESSYANLRFHGELRDRLFRKTTDHSTVSPQVRFQRLLVGQSDVQAFQVAFPRRGRYWVGPAKINCWFPFGLIVSHQYIDQECSVMVGPELGLLNPTWEKRLSSTAKGTDSVRRSKAIQEDEFYALRRWRSGDSRKNIHWRSTAKQQFPMVKQFVERNNRDFSLVLDLFADDNQPHTLHDCEKVLSFAATILRRAKVALEGQVALAVCGKTLDVFRSKTINGVAIKTMPALAVAAGQKAPAIAEGVISCLDSVSNGTPIYVISSREMPASLTQGLPLQANPNETETELGANSKPIRRSKYIARRMRTGLPMVRWLTVQSDEFKEIFSMDKKQQHRSVTSPSKENQSSTNQKETEARLANQQTTPADLAEISEKWVGHAEN